LKRLVAHYETLPEDVLNTGLIHFAAYPPDDTGFLITRLWDKYLPGWRSARDIPKPMRDPEEEKRILEEINRQTDSPELQPRQSAGWYTQKKAAGSVSPRSRFSGCWNMKKIKSELDNQTSSVWYANSKRRNNRAQSPTLIARRILRKLLTPC
jgi:hypothetical protein